MKFGKEFRIHLEETLPEWRDKYLCYKPLKKLLKNLPPTTDEQNQHPHPPPPPLEASVDTVVVDPSGHVAPPEGCLPPLAGLEEWFVNILSDELEKFNDFYVEKEEDFIIRFQVFFPFHPLSLTTIIFASVDYFGVSTAVFGCKFSLFHQCLELGSSVYSSFGDLLYNNLKF